MAGWSRGAAAVDARLMANGSGGAARHPIELLGGLHPCGLLALSRRSLLLVLFRHTSMHSIIYCVRDWLQCEDCLALREVRSLGLDSGTRFSTDP
jgi:hypothetical protein